MLTYPVVPLIGWHQNFVPSNAAFFFLNMHHGIADSYANSLPMKNMITINK